MDIRTQNLGRATVDRRHKELEIIIKINRVEGNQSSDKIKEIDKGEYIINLIIELMFLIKEVLTIFYFKEVK